MEQASDAMKQARESQVNEWKSELTNALDQAIQEMLQMARQEQQLEQKARSGQAKPEEMRGEQSAVKQGLDNAAQKLQQEGQKTSLLSGRSQRSVAEAQQKVSEATQQTADARGSQQAANSLGEAADALNRAAASLARDREKANTSSSATGFAEMMQQLQEMAKKQGSINAQAQGLMPGMGQPMSSQMQGTARALAREQRQVAQQLDEIGDAVGGDRAAQLAKEAKAARRGARGRTARRDDGRAPAAAVPSPARRGPLAAEGRARGHEQARGDVGEGRQRAQARQRQRDRARRAQVPRADVGRAARADRRPASRDPRVLQADQCGNAVARDAGSGKRERGKRPAADRRAGPRVRSRSRFPLPASRVARRAERASAPGDTMAFYKALDLEAAGKYREAVPLFRIGAAHVGGGQRAARTRARVRGARLVRLARRAARYADRGEPARRDVSHGAAAHAADGRTTGRSAARVRGVDSRHAGERRRRIASTRGCCCRGISRPPPTAFCCARDRALGTTKDLQLELAQTRAAQGQWIESARAWRAGAAHRRLSRAGGGVRARADAVVVARADARGLSRAADRSAVAARARRARDELGLAGRRMERAQGSAARQRRRGGVVGVREARREPKTAGSIARDALESALRWKRTPELVDSRRDRRDERRRRAGARCASRRSPTRTATPRSSRASYLPLHARALAALGRPAEAERLVDAYDRFLAPGAHNSLTRTIAWGWVRTGDMARARAALAATGAEGDSSDAAGWLALYEGNLKSARGLLRGGTESVAGARVGARAHRAAQGRQRAGDRTRVSRARARRQRRRRRRSSSQAAEQTPAVRSLLLLLAAQIQVGLQERRAADRALDAHSRAGRRHARSAAGRARVGATLRRKGDVGWRDDASRAHDSHVSAERARAAGASRARAGEERHSSNGT